MKKRENHWGSFMGLWGARRCQGLLLGVWPGYCHVATQGMETRSGSCRTGVQVAGTLRDERVYRIEVVGFRGVVEVRTLSLEGERTHTRTSARAGESGVVGRGDKSGLLSPPG